MGTSADAFADAHINAFNEAVAAADYRDFLAGFTDDAVIRFENVPGGADLEFTGRAAYTAAYEASPPDDQMDIAGPVGGDLTDLSIPFAWRRDGARGTIRLTIRDGSIARMTVVFAG